MYRCRPGSSHYRPRQERVQPPPHPVQEAISDDREQAGKVKTRISKLEDGTVIYKVSFTSGDLWYSYKIDAVTGEILDKTTESTAEHKAAKAERGEHSTKEGESTEDKPETSARDRHHGGSKGDSGSAKKPGSDKKDGKKDGRNSKPTEPATGTDGTV